MKYLDFVFKLTEIGPRFCQDEKKAIELIEEELKQNSVSFEVQNFKTNVPENVAAELTIDGENIPCIGSSLVSGEIPDGKYLVSHFGYSGEKTPYNIAYSPVTDEISVVDHFEVPSITISRQSIIKVIMGKEIKGRVKVEKKEIETANILVGNLLNPENIIFAHFDSIIGKGAVDNAGSVAVLMGLILENREKLNNSLYIFVGNEEICFDGGINKSGYGFRVFESKYAELLRSCKKIVVLDGVGVGEADLTQENLDWVLQLNMLAEIRSKIYWLRNDQSEVLKYFHTKSDNAENLKEEFLVLAKDQLLKFIE